MKRILSRLSFLANTQGIIPDPINAERIYKDNYQNGEGGQTIYTVPAGKKLFITTAWISARNSNTTSGEAYLQLRNASAQKIYMMACIRFDISGQGSMPQLFIPALEGLAGYDVRLDCTNAGIDARAGFTGYLQDA